MHRTALVLVLSAVVASGSLCAGQAVAQQPLTLAEALRLAAADNPDLAAARLARDAAAGGARQARLWPNPELEFSSEDFPTDGGGFSEAQNMVGLSQTVPFPGKKRLDADIGRESAAAAESAYQGREREIALDVKSAFYRALAADKRVAVSEELLDLSRSLGDAARKRVEAGAVGRQESVRAEIELERVGVNLSAARQALAEERKILARLLGRPDEPLGPLQDEWRESAPLPDFDRLREDMLARHPDLGVALANRERANLEARRAGLDPLPDVTLGIAGGRNGASDEDLMEFRVSVPLPLLDRAQGRKRETLALADLARADRTATEQRLLQELGIAGARLRGAIEQVDAYRDRILPKADEALRLVRGGFEAGKFGFLDLVDTQRTAAETRLEYLDKLLELNLALAELESLAGVELSE
jgi:outer membrane protein, heavy metal efflux system